MSSIILGIDPGSRATGYGVIESNGSRHRYMASGCIRTQSKDFAERLGEIFAGLQSVIAQHQPEQMAIEQVFLSNNPSSAIKLGQARGAAITAVISKGIPVYEYSARSIKQAVVGRGAADKEQVQHMVRILLNMNKKMGLDESDALAIAVCHAHSHTTLQQIGAIR